jgi:Dolichyl-phosphate-mannose-protein mannosyltransferase
LSTFGAGLIVVGSARLIITLALFLLFKELTGSSRLAGIAALAYCGNPNYLFFSAEFSYESLALPLAVVVLYCVARWLKREEDTDDRSLLICAAIVGIAVVMTHHITSYALLASLLGIATALARSDRRRGSLLGGLSFLLALVTVLWLKVVAGRTATYLGAIFGRAFGSIEHTIKREEGARNVLSSGGNGPPPWDRTLAYLWVLTLLVAIVLGVLRIRRDYRGSILAVGLAGAGIAYLGVLPLRLVSGAWELANRSSEFLFVGVALLVALACGYLVRLRHGPLPAGSTVVVLIIVAGGALGWPRDLRTAQALRVSAGGATLEPPMLTAVRWAGSHLGSGRTFDGGDVDARFLGSVAHDRVYAGFSPFDISDVITMSTRRIPPWGLRNLRATRAGFVFIDQRQQAGNRLQAPYFHTATLNSSNALNSPDEFLKFDRQPGTSRIYDGGSIKIYDIRRMVDATRRK